MTSRRATASNAWLESTPNARGSGTSEWWRRHCIILTPQEQAPHHEPLVFGADLREDVLLEGIEPLNLQLDVIHHLLTRTDRIPDVYTAFVQVPAATAISFSDATTPKKSKEGPVTVSKAVRSVGATSSLRWYRSR
jgi:hypothetical protein